MKPLLILIAVFVLSLIGTKLFSGRFELALSGRVAMTAMLLFTALGHFMFTKGMALMLPSFIPFKKETIYVTGMLEIAAAIGLLLPGFRIITGWLLLLFFLLILPANIYAALKHINYQTGSFDGSGPHYLWFRVPLQLFFMAWVYFFAIRV